MQIERHHKTKVRRKLKKKKSIFFFKSQLHPLRDLCVHYEVSPPMGSEICNENEMCPDGILKVIMADGWPFR